MKEVPNIEVKTRAELEAEGYDSDQIVYADSTSSLDVESEDGREFVVCPLYRGASLIG
jgi:hypothetical protein